MIPPEDNPEDTTEQWRNKQVDAFIDQGAVSDEAGWQAPTCWTCRFWTRNNGRIQSANDAKCRRHAPQPGLVRFVNSESEHGGPELKYSGYVKHIWPITEADDWCGDHQPFVEPAE
jgi:hypothetical protein